MLPSLPRAIVSLLITSSLLLFHIPGVFSWDATWESLDQRPLPTWYEDAKFGIFIHWGVFSVPSYGSEWFWWWWQGAKFHEYGNYVNETEKVKFAYAEYAHRFDATLYRPDEWAEAFAKSGAQYIVPTSKHHEGFCNWDSRSVPTTWNWNAMEVGPRRDLIGDLAKAVKAQTSPQTNLPLKFGVYHSLLEWFNPLFQLDHANNYTTRYFVEGKTMPELYDLVEKYEPELIWSDGDWDSHSDYWKAKDFLAWYATNSTVAETAVWNDRWGKDSLCKHGSFLTCQDKYQPGKYVEHKWENAMTIDVTSWGLNRNATYSKYLTTKSLIHTLIETVAFHGNLLLNVGPGADGTISPIFIDRLLGMGEWLQVNGEAIYQSRGWSVCQEEPPNATTTTVPVYYTTRPDKDTLYAIFTEWPHGNELHLTCPQSDMIRSTTTMTLLGLADKMAAVEHVSYDDDSIFTRLGNVGFEVTESGGLVVKLPPLTPDIIPCQHAWVVALTHTEGGISSLKGGNPVPSTTTTAASTLAEATKP